MSTTRLGGKGSFIENVNADINAGKFSSSTSYQRRQSDGWQLSNITEDSVPTVAKCLINSLGHREPTFCLRSIKNLNLYVEGSYFTKELDRPVNKDAKDPSGFDYDMSYETTLWDWGENICSVIPLILAWMSTPTTTSTTKYTPVPSSPRATRPPTSEMKS